jgi:hypothetical protein
VSLAYETFEVVEVNERHGFARVRSERTGGVLHTELTPEGQPDRLRVGDRIQGLARGQNVGRVSWVSRAPPPPEEVTRAAALLQDLARFGYQLPISAEQLADAQGRAEQAGALTSVLRQRFPIFFDEREEADASLFERFEAAMSAHLKGFQIKPVAREAKVVTEPGGVTVPLGSVSDPVALFEPLLSHANERLETAGAPVRWVPVRRNWILASPLAVRLLESHGLVQPRTIH